MDHFKVKVGKVDEPACLLSVECLGLAEVGEVLVIRGVGQLAMPSSLTGSMASWPGLTIILRYLTSSVANLHFSSFKWRSSSVMRCKTRLVRSSWRVESGEKTRRLSMEMTSHPSAIMLRMESFMNRWKVAGELVSPKNMTVGLNSLYG